MYTTDNTRVHDLHETLKRFASETIENLEDMFPITDSS